MPVRTSWPSTSPLKTDPEFVSGALVSPIADLGCAGFGSGATGTWSGAVAGAPPTHRRVSFNNINIYRFESGRVAETRQLADGLGLSRQMGGVPFGS